MFSKAKNYGIGSLHDDERKLVFEDLDINHDAVLNVDELTQAYMKLSGKPKQEANKTAQDAITSFKGDITFSQFDEWVRQPPSPESKLTGGGTKTETVVEGSGMGETPETEEAKPLSEPAATAKGNKPASKRSNIRMMMDGYLDESGSDSDDEEGSSVAGALFGTLTRVATAVTSGLSHNDFEELAKNEQNSSGGESKETKETEENAMKDGQIWRRRRRKMDTSGEYGYENQTWYKVRVKGDVLALVRFKPGDDPQTPTMGYEADQNKTDFKMEDYERVLDNDIADAQTYMQNLGRSLEEQRGSKSHKGEEAEPAAKEDPYLWVEDIDVPAMKTEGNTRVKVCISRNGGRIRASDFFMGRITNIHEDDGVFFDVDYDDKTTNPTTEARVPMQWVQVRKPERGVYTFDKKPAEGGEGPSINGAVAKTKKSEDTVNASQSNMGHSGTESLSDQEEVQNTPHAPEKGGVAIVHETEDQKVVNLSNAPTVVPSAPPLLPYAERAEAEPKAAKAQRKRETKPSAPLQDLREIQLYDQALSKPDLTFTRTNGGSSVVLLSTKLEKNNNNAVRGVFASVDGKQRFEYLWKNKKGYRGGKLMDGEKPVEGKSIPKIKFPVDLGFYKKGVTGKFLKNTHGKKIWTALYLRTYFGKLEQKLNN